jgi:signal transduction histidine kinase
MSAIEKLRQVPFLSHLTDEQLKCIEKGSELWLDSGDILVEQGEMSCCFYILTSGEIRFTQKVDEQEIPLVSYQAGTFFGEIPLLLDQPFIATGRAMGECHLFKFCQEDFWELLAACPIVMQRILKEMAQRASKFESVSQQREKLASLGNLASGLAHELNNPASAGQRAAEHLQEKIVALGAIALKINQQLTPEQLQFLIKLQEQVKQNLELDPLIQCEKEEEIADWLDFYNILDGWKIAPNLVRAGITPKLLETIAQKVKTTESLAIALTWLETTITVAELFEQLDRSSKRVADLVGAIKSYSYMDRGSVQDVDIHEGLENTLLMLNYKLKQGVAVTREYDRNLPRIQAHGSELNQVWTNLIDNAIDATNRQGQIWIRTKREDRCLLIEIADNGVGIPPEIQPHIFEPFYTTKEVGSGRGLGLYLSYRIVVKVHRGDITISSQPGDTSFQVRLPIAPLSK